MPPAKPLHDKFGRLTNPGPPDPKRAQQQLVVDAQAQQILDRFAPAGSVVVLPQSLDADARQAAANANAQRVLASFPNTATAWT